MLDFKGKVFIRDNVDKIYNVNKIDNVNEIGYKNAVIQYASSSVTDDRTVMNPALIIYAENDQDVFKAIKYAQKNNCAIAIRTGGHQYCGMSSTSGKNIQLDLSKTYKSFDVSKLDTDSLITCGISFSLDEFSNRLVENNIFVPHGECPSVHLGGHIQTGGYGVFCPQFGILGDHVVSFDIITADCIKRTVTRETNPDLFFAVLGGSPGNFGVMTHITLKVYKDNLFPESRGLMAIYPYRESHLKNLLSLLGKWKEDESIPKNISFKITTRDPCTDTFFIQPFKAIVVIAMYIPGLDNKKDLYNPKYFNDILKTSPSNISINNRNFDLFRIPLNYLPNSSAFKRLYINENVNTPLSILGNKSVFKFVTYREYNLPFIKRSYNNKVLRDNEIELFAKMNTKIGRFLPFKKVDCVSILEVAFIKENSQLLENKTNGTGYNFREYSHLVFDIFYYNKDTAIKYIKEIDKTAKTDKRVFWGSYIKEDECLTQTLFSEKYYDSKEKYDRILKIKNKYDSNKIFSPNNFCIGGMKE